MEFYGREKELAALRTLREKAGKSARFTVVTGRRRIGKTALLMHAYDDDPLLYFFVARQAHGTSKDNRSTSSHPVTNLPLP